MSEKKVFLTTRVCQLLQVANRGGIGRMDTHSITRQLGFGDDTSKIYATLNNLKTAGHIRQVGSGERSTWEYQSMPLSPYRSKGAKAEIAKPAITGIKAPSRQPTPFNPLQRDPLANWRLCMRDQPESSQSAATRYVVG